MDEYIEQFVKHLKEYKKEQRKLPFDQRNILAPSTPAQMAFNCMIDCFLGEGWYVSYPACTEQINTEACYEILYRHSRKFRKLIKRAKRDLESEVNDAKIH